MAVSYRTGSAAGNTSGFTNETTWTLTLGTITTGDTVVVAVAAGAAGGSGTNTIALSGGGVTWTQAGTPGQGGGSGFGTNVTLAVFTATAGASTSGAVVTATLSVSSQVQMASAAYPGSQLVGYFTPTAITSSTGSTVLGEPSGTVPESGCWLVDLIGLWTATTATVTLTYPADAATARTTEGAGDYQALSLSDSNATVATGSQGGGSWSWSGNAAGAGCVLVLAPAGIQFVQRAGNSNVTSAGSPFTVAVTAQTATAHTIIAEIKLAAGVLVAGITDSKGNVWHVDGWAGTSAITVVFAHCYQWGTPLGPGDTVTVTQAPVAASPTTAQAQLLEFLGISPYPPVDYPVGAGNASNANITSLTVSASGTGTAAAGELLLTGTGSNSSQTWTPPSGYTELPTGLGAGATCDAAYQIAASAGTSASVTWTQANAANITALIVAYRPGPAPFTRYAARTCPVGVYRGPCGIMQQNGAYASSGGAGLGIAAYAQWIGRPVTYPHDYTLDNPTTWAQFEGANVQNATGIYTTIQGWGTLPAGQTLVISVPACAGVSVGSGGTTWAAESSGTNDTHWTNLGNNLISWGYSNAIIRLGREFNGNWYHWSPAQTGDTSAQYIAGWQHIVTLLKGLTGAHFKFMWNPTLASTGGGTGTMESGTHTPSPAETLSWYPGDSYVDYIGYDLYDWGQYTSLSARPYTRTTAQNQWNFSNAEVLQDNLNQQLAFAWVHSKPVAFPEWGDVLFLSGGNYVGGGDDPAYYGQMADIVPWGLYESHWEIPGSGLFDSDTYASRVSGLAPDKSRTAFLALLGGGGAALAGTGGITVSTTGGSTGFFTPPASPTLNTPNVYRPGQVLAIEDVNNFFIWQAAIKTAATTRASTTTLTADPDLQLTPQPGAYYQVLLVVRYNGPGTNNFNWAFAAPSGSTFTYSHWNNYTNVRPPNPTVTVYNVTVGGYTDGTATRYNVVCRGILATGSTSGTFSFNWAQATSNATATTVDQYSHLRIRRVG